MQRNVGPVNKLISFINHGLIASTLLGINICSKIEISAWILARDNIEAILCCASNYTLLYCVTTSSGTELHYCVSH